MVENEPLQIIWSPDARRALRKAYERIKEDSPKNAVKVRDTILEMIEQLPNNPNQHPPDRFKLDNSGNYRAFEKYNYRVSYRFSDKEIRILRFRHVKQKPIKY